jgi:hypothetical protein
MVVHARARGFGGGCRQAASKIEGARPIHTSHGSIYPNGKRYRALVRHGPEILYVGTFDTPEEASKFAERLAKQLRGKLYTPVAKRKTASTR